MHKIVLGKIDYKKNYSIQASKCKKKNHAVASQRYSILVVLKKKELTHFPNKKQNKKKVARKTQKILSLFSDV